MSDPVGVFSRAMAFAIRGSRGLHRRGQSDLRHSRRGGADCHRSSLLGEAPEARILADQLWCALEDLRDRGRFSRDIGELRQFVAEHQHRWR